LHLCSMGEFLAVQLARDLRDSEKAIIGTNSDIQVAACNLARRMHAPSLWWISGPGGMVNADDPVIRPTADYENIANSEALLDLPLMIDFIDWKIHFFDFAILGALQIDKFGNINTVCVGPHEKPRLRGPGTVGISALCGLSRRFYVMMLRHERGAFVGTSRWGQQPGRARPAGGRSLPGRHAARHLRFRARQQTHAGQVAASRRDARAGSRQYGLRACL